MSDKLNKYCVWLILIGFLNLTFSTNQLNGFTFETEYCEQIDAEGFQAIDITENVFSNEFIICSPFLSLVSERSFPEIQIYITHTDFTIDTPPPDMT
ncbi:MAG: hypothetical protein IPK35_12205 [Saprospiraceae bacterium]|jgi:hypothetical protein|nr:hypothetical protein [Saprospiraceae bacterium]